jgi:predicted negative regulator of RcsB-dependent stress response
MMTMVQFWIIIGVLFSIIGGIFMWAIVIERQITNMITTSKAHEERLTLLESEKKENYIRHLDEINKTAKILHENNQVIFNKLDEITKITTDIRIKCASHFPKIN